MDLQIVRPLELSDDDRAAWRALQQTSRELDSPFLSPDWALAVEAAEGAGSSARVAVLRRGGQACGFLPLSIPHQSARPLGGPLCDYQAAVTEPGCAFDPLAVIEALHVARFDFASMLRSQSAFVPHFRGAVPAFAADAAQGYDRYAEGMGGPAGVLGELDDVRAEVEAALGPIAFTALSRRRDDLIELLGWRGEVLPDWAAGLIHQLFLDRDQAFGGGLFTLHAGERLIAAQFHLRGRHTLHAWLCAHDRALERFSPSLLLSQDILRWMDETPYSTLDFGVGGARTGRPLSNVVRNVGVGTVSHPSPASLLRAAAGRLRSAAGLASAPELAALPGRAARSALRALR